MMNARTWVLLWTGLFLLQAAPAQKRYNVWAFGANAGLDFNTSPPTVLDTTNASAVGNTDPYYVSSICDRQGNLLFYTDGFTTWNKNHEVIPKYQYRWPWSGYVMPLICPYPGNDSLYYLFGVSQGSYANQLQYLTINMKAPGGEIIYPQPSTLFNFFTVLLPNASVALAGATHCNQTDQWIITYASGAFSSFLVSKTGVDPAPVVSPVAATVLSPYQLELGFGNLKLSANSEKLIVPLAAQGEVVVFDFNNQTGAVFNPVSLRVPQGQILEDAEISPDGTKLYMAAYEVTNANMKAERHWVYQLDLQAGTPAQIEATRHTVNGFGDAVICSPRVCFTIRRTLQLAPDGKIYVTMRGQDETISIIEQPNRRGNDAFYQRNALNLKRNYQLINYNYIRSGSFSLRENGIQLQKKTCADQPVAFSLLFSRVDSVEWDFGDPASGSRNFSTSLRPEHQYPGPGTYTAKAIIYSRCLTDTATAQVVIDSDKAVQVPHQIVDTTLCAGSSLTLDASVYNAKAYRWENGLKFPNRTIDQAGQYEITVMNDCSYDRRSFEVAFEKCECRVWLPTAFTPNNDGKNDAFKPVVQCFAQDYQFTIFNRYGGVVFQSTEVGKAWNGKVKNLPVPAGVYLWVLQYRDPAGKDLVQDHGTVALIR